MEEEKKNAFLALVPYFWTDSLDYSTIFTISTLYRFCFWRPIKAYPNCCFKSSSVFCLFCRNRESRKRAVYESAGEKKNLLLKTIFFFLKSVSESYFFFSILNGLLFEMFMIQVSSCDSLLTHLSLAHATFDNISIAIF